MPVFLILRLQLLLDGSLIRRLSYLDDKIKNLFSSANRKPTYRNKSEQIIDYSGKPTAPANGRVVIQPIGELELVSNRK